MKTQTVDYYSPPSDNKERQILEEGHRLIIEEEWEAWDGWVLLYSSRSFLFKGFRYALDAIQELRTYDPESFRQWAKNRGADISQQEVAEKTFRFLLDNLKQRRPAIAVAA